MLQWLERHPNACRHAVAAALIAVLAACASVPSQEMSDARRALDAARDARAQEHAPESIQRARRALEDATGALRDGQYERARGLASAARDEAIASRVLAAHVTEASAGIARARATGRPWAGAQRMLDAAQAAARAGDTVRAGELAARAVELAR